MSYGNDPLVSFILLIVGIILGRILEKAKWIEKFIDMDLIKKRFGKNKDDNEESGIAE